MKKLRVTIEGKVYDVLVEILEEGAKTLPSTLPTATQPLETAAMSFGAPSPSRAAAPTATPVAPQPVASPAASGDGDVASPLAGKIVSIDVTVGQAVEEGSQVATIEAMKMNTYIFAPKSGRVLSLHASPGDGVEEGTVLLRIS
jgi:biotin carboxyl carrier protein